MRTFFVRPDSAQGYGAGAGTSYENAWNGLKSVDWDALHREPATLWVCGTPNGPQGFVTVHVEWSYLKANGDNALPARPDPRREPALAV